MVTTRAKQSGNKTLLKLSSPFAWAAAATALIISPWSSAASWKITPSLNLSETYSDNVGLATSGAEKSDFITQISPGISLTGTGSHLKANINYVMQNIAYASERSKNTTNHQLSANANAELIDHFFYLDGKAGLSQQNISLFGAQPTDNTNITGNRTDVATYSLSPYLRHRFDGIATSELRYTHDEVKASVGGFSNSKADSALFNLNSGPAFRKLGWGLHYSKYTTDYSSRPSVDTETYSGNLRLVLTPKFSLIASKGQEKNNYISTSATPAGGFWTAGFAWTPSARTSLSASTGERFFGKTHALSAIHRSRNTVWSVNYSEDITSTSSQFLDTTFHTFKVPATTTNADLLDKILTTIDPNLDPASRKQKIDDAIASQNAIFYFPQNNINYLTNRIFLQKQLSASVAINHSKSTFVFSAFSTVREAQTAQTNDSPILSILGQSNLALNDSTKSIGGNQAISTQGQRLTQSETQRAGHQPGQRKLS
jgi:uncharacterized protein (PEP-CTERM system associated)